MRKFSKNMQMIVAFLVPFTAINIIAGIIGGSLGSLGIGPLLWGFSPLIVTFIVVTAYKQWSIIGLRPMIREKQSLYGFILLAIPLLSVLNILINLGFGFITGIEIDISNYSIVLAVGIPVFIVLAFVEEIAWRGFLVTKLRRMNLSPLLIVTIVSVVWTAWHLPFINQITWIYSNPQLLIFIPAFFVINFVYSLIYYRLKTTTQSIWPVVLMHGLTNAIQHPLALEAISLDPRFFYLSSFSGLIMAFLLLGFYAVLLKATKENTA